VKLQQPDQRSAREIAYLHIQKKIASRALRAGTPVSELPIAHELGISRTPTREAMRQLVAEGLLEEIPGRGVVVVKLDRHDLIELYELREALELQAVRKSASHPIGAAELQNLHKVADEMRALIQELKRSGKPKLDQRQMSRFEAADIGFHMYLLRVAGNRRSLKLLNEIRLLIRTFAMRSSGHGVAGLKQIYEDHCEVIAGIEARDPARATAALSTHIQTSQRERLEQFDQREREAALPQDIPSFIDQIQADLV
jgi:DNA-binding GntR family transcriptional regulator